MNDDQIDLHALDAAYQPFPPFIEWTSQTVVDVARWDRYNKTLEDRSNLSPDVLGRAREIAKRAAAIDTGALEDLYEVDRGFTFTVAMEIAAWEAALAAKGEHVRSLFEAQLRAYDYVLDLATKAEPLSEAAIRALHIEVCRAQSTYRVMTPIGPQERPLPKGTYKVLPNHVRTRKGTYHSYAPVDMTSPEMARFVQELRDDTFLAAHPVMQAAYAHYAFVLIHPFADGNGRVARALASAFTYRAISMPIVILVEHKTSYLDSLEAADSGNYQSFVDFMLARALDTIQLVDESIRSGLIPALEDNISVIKRLYITRGGYTQERVDSAGIKLLELFGKEVTNMVAKYNVPPITAGAGARHGQHKLQHGDYRSPIQGGRGWLIDIATAAPAKANVQRLYWLEVPRDAAGDDDIRLRLENKSDSFTARVDEILPTLSGILQIRMNMFVERIFGEMLSELATNAEQALRSGRGQ